MNTIQWKMYNCDCVIQYDYDPELGDTVANRVNHRHVSKCQYHQDLDQKELHDELCNEQTQVSIAQKKIIEEYPSMAKDGAINDEKVVVGLDDKRDLVCVVQGLSEPEMSNLKTTLEAVCDRSVKVL